MLFSPKMKIPQNGVSQTYHEQTQIIVAISPTLSFIRYTRIGLFSLSLSLAKQE
jgi:hypothetical protein